MEHRTLYFERSDLARFAKVSGGTILRDILLHRLTPDAQTARGGRLFLMETVQKYLEQRRSGAGGGGGQSPS